MMQIVCVVYKICIIICLCLHMTCILATEKLTPINPLQKLEQMNKVGGPVYTFVKTDKEANIKWGVHHYVPRKSKIKANS